MTINPFAAMQEEFDHTGFVFNPDNNKVLTLNRSGVVLWKALEDGLSIDECAALLMERFDISDINTARQDVEKFVQDLIERSLLSME